MADLEYWKLTYFSFISIRETLINAHRALIGVFFNVGNSLCSKELRREPLIGRMLRPD